MSSFLVDLHFAFLLGKLFWVVMMFWKLQQLLLFLLYTHNMTLFLDLTYPSSNGFTKHLAVD